MFSHEVKIRVRYAETDKMGYVYYGNYATYFEVGRVEAMRALGVSYKTIEATGIMMPVAEYSVKYLRPVFYDEKITVKTTIKELPKARITFYYETYKETGELANEAFTTLAFYNIEKQRPCPAPKELTDAIGKNLSNSAF